MKFAVSIELERVSGPEQDQETMVDAFCAYLGQQNGAGADAYRVVINDDEDDSVYVVKLVDDKDARLTA